MNNYWLDRKQVKQFFEYLTRCTGENVTIRRVEEVSPGQWGFCYTYETPAGRLMMDGIIINAL